MRLLNDLMFVERLGFHLQGFAKAADQLWTFRCPVCGDSKKNKSKKRGHIFPNKERTALVFKCHNCGDSRSFSNLVKFVDQRLFQEYLFAAMGKSKSVLERLPERAEEIKPAGRVAIKAPITAVRMLPDDHMVVKYISSRKIPQDKWAVLAYTDKFHALAKSIDPDYNFPDKLLNKRAPALILPFMNEKGQFFGMQGRFLDPEAKIRYITILKDKKLDRTFGLDKVNKLERFFVLEGPIDSMFLSNAIAVCGSDMGRIEGENAVFVPDSEPRNPHIVKKIDNLIKAGRKVVLLPKQFAGTDVNDLVLSGYEPEEVEELLDQHTYSGLVASVKFANWRKS